MATEDEILNKLVIEEKDVTKEMDKLIEEATNYFKIEKPSGKIIFKNFGILNDKQRISIVLLGKYFAHRLKIIESSSLSISEISKELGRPMTTLSSKLKELLKEGYIEYLPGKKYVIAYHRIKEVFENVLNSKPKK